MISKRHTKLKYEAGIDLEDLSVFYDFKEADNEFLRSIGVEKKTPEPSEDAVVEDDGDEDWEDVSEDEEMAEAEEDGGDDDYDAEYEAQLAQFGFDVTELGELVLPNGRVIGHRALSRYYRQRVPSQNTSTAVVAARRAAGERLFNGQVINIHGSEQNSLALARAGIKPGDAAGRAGKGILNMGAGGVYTSLSIYRYRAAMRKQRVEDKQFKRLHEKTSQNMNKMDKKHNRLMNGKCRWIHCLLFW
jgi:pre-60S factor REI1